jgi:hypothetical protein
MIRNSIFLKFRESNDKLKLKRSYGADPTRLGGDRRCSLIAPVVSLMRCSWTYCKADDNFTLIEECPNTLLVSLKGPTWSCL